MLFSVSTLRDRYSKFSRFNLSKQSSARVFVNGWLAPSAGLPLESRWTTLRSCVFVDYNSFAPTHSANVACDNNGCVNNADRAAWFENRRPWAPVSGGTKSGRAVVRAAEERAVTTQGSLSSSPGSHWQIWKVSIACCLLENKQLCFLVFLVCSETYCIAVNKDKPMCFFSLVKVFSSLVQRFELFGSPLFLLIYRKFAFTAHPVDLLFQSGSKQRFSLRGCEFCEMRRVDGEVPVRSTSDQKRPRSRVAFSQTSDARKTGPVALGKAKGFSTLF